MRCNDCHYSLENLTKHRCPECGREFDPNDPDTFLGSPRFWPRSVKQWVGFWLIASLILSILYYLLHPRVIYESL
ncbi:MAG: hypothetical protein L0Y44_06065 [Phycisphaerales bacterium]|nr:hypothetical protein [Phycisphaerales bacterium]MCI0630205.1 hypothetical protein [Phycisphaerales bacterium]